MEFHNLDTTDWQSFEIEVGDNLFVSKVSPTSPFLEESVENLNVANYRAISFLIPDGSTRSEITAILKGINEGATHAVLELV